MGDWVLVIPVKRLALAKTRLASFAGDGRAGLALAFASDTIAAAASCDRVLGIAVVTDDPLAAALARDRGHLVIADEPDAGLNPALVHGAAVALEHWPGGRVAALSSDLPALRPADLGAALDRAADHRCAFVADSGGTGTTLLAASGLAGFLPSFGADSASAHRTAGAYELRDLELPSLRRDVDTEDDLLAAEALGLGPASTAVLARLPH